MKVRYFLSGIILYCPLVVCLHLMEPNWSKFTLLVISSFCKNLLSRLFIGFAPASNAHLLATRLLVSVHCLEGDQVGWKLDLKLEGRINRR